jgi:hypothetical protein
MTEQIATQAYDADHNLVDSIVYLASLAAQPSAIDPALDTLRIVTTRWTPGAPLAEADRAALYQVVADLKDYLVNHDPLRSFTYEGLERRLQGNLQNKGASSKYTLTFWPAVFSCLGLAAGTLIVPSALSLWNRIFLAIPVFLTLTTLANAWFYLSSLNGFKVELRQAFWYLCAGTVGLGVQFLHFAYIPLSGQGELPLYKYGGLPVIGFLAILVIYLGLRKYAKLLNLTNPYMSPWMLSGVLVATTAVTTLVVYLFSVPGKAYLVFSLANFVGISALSLFGSRIALAITHSVTTLYAVSIHRLYIFLTAVFAGALAYAFVVAGLGGLSGNALSVTLGVCATPALLFLLHSGSSFKKETNR